MPLFDPTITAAAAAATAAPQPTIAGSRADIIAASSALTTPSPIVPPGMVRPYLAHQGAAHVAANGAIARHGCALLGDDMGMGKTQVLFGLIAERIAHGGYAIMVAPPVALAGYRSDLAASFPTLRMAHLAGRKPDFRNLPIADLYFLSDDSLTMSAWLTTTTIERKGGKDVKVQHANAFATGCKVFTRDEIHRDKGSSPQQPSGRSRTMLAVGAGLRDAGVPIIAATGTLLTNRPSEAYLPLRAIGGDSLLVDITPNAQKPSGYLWYFCAPQHNGFGTAFGCNFARMPELHDMLRSTVYVRREKSDLGEALPHSGWIIKPIALNGVLTRYRRIEKQFLDLVLEEQGPEAMWRKARAEAITRMSAMWEEAGVAKVAASAEYVKDLVDEGRKVVVFYYHQRTWDGLATAFVKAGIETCTINGAVTGEARVRAIADFQDGDAQVCLAQIRAAGMAVTLTGAADAVFVQVPWSAGDLKQAADRILRVDDRTMARAQAGERITWHVLQAAHDDGAPTFDMAMWDVLERKAQVCDAVNAGKAVTMPDDRVMQEALTAWFPTAQRRYA
jgi:hypothetical protein